MTEEFQRKLIDGIGCLPGEHLDEFADRIVRGWAAKGAEIEQLRGDDGGLRAEIDELADLARTREGDLAEVGAERDRANAKAAEYCRLYQDTADQLAAAESSRRDWAAEAMRLEMELERMAAFAGSQSNARRAADKEASRLQADLAHVMRERDQWRIRWAARHCDCEHDGDVCPHCDVPVGHCLDGCPQPSEPHLAQWERELLEQDPQ